MKQTQQDNIPPGYLRVTEILSPYTSFDHIEPHVLARAADRGTRVHSFCESYMKAKALHAHSFVIDSVDEDCKPYFKSFVDWYDFMIEDVIFMEKRLNCPKIRVSGQLDILAIIKGDEDLSLIDTKTPQVASPTWQLQTAGYDYLLESVEGIKATRRICLMLDKDGGRPKIKEYTNHKKDRELFLSAVEIYRCIYG